MKNIYFSSTLLWNSSIEEIFEKANLNNYEGIEIWVQQFLEKRSALNSIAKLKERYDLKVLTHAVNWDINIASLNRGIRIQSINEVKKSIIFAKKVGALSLTVHPGKESVRGRLDNIHMRLLKESLQEIAEFGYKNSVEISLELMEHEPKEILYTPEYMNEILSSIDFPVKTTFDAAHMEREELIYTYLKSLKNIDKIHISNKKGGTYHVPMPDGDYDMQKVLDEALKLNVPIVIEGFDDSKNGEAFYKNNDFIKKLEESKGDVLIEKEI